MVIRYPVSWERLRKRLRVATLALGIVLVFRNRRMRHAVIVAVQAIEARTDSVSLGPNLQTGSAAAL